MHILLHTYYWLCCVMWPEHAHTHTDTHTYWQWHTHTHTPSSTCTHSSLHTNKATNALRIKYNQLESVVLHITSCLTLCNTHRLWIFKHQGPRSSQIHCGLTHNAEHYVERFAASLCSEKLVTTYNVSLRIREDLGPRKRHEIAHRPVNTKLNEV